MTVGALLGEVWGFVRARPGLVAIWGALHAAIGLLLRLSLQPLHVAEAAAIRAGQPLGGAALRPVLLVVPLATAALLVLYAAVYRAFLRPEEERFAFLRLGADEARLLGLGLLLWLGLTVAFVGVGVVAVLAAVLLGVRGGGGVPVLLLLLLGAMVWLWVRLSLAAPMTLALRKVTIGGAWRATRGRFWTLLGAYLVVGVVLALVGLLLSLPTLGPMLASLNGPGDAALRLAEFRVAQAQAWHTPLGLAQLAAGAVLGAVLLVFAGGVPAAAVRRILPADAAAPPARRGPWSIPAAEEDQP